MGRTTEAAADCTRAIELPGAPPETVAQVLVNRGVTHGDAGRTTKALNLPPEP